MKQLLLKILESVLLFGALFFTLPYIPSHEIERLPLFPTAAFAVILFVSSRGLRWRPHWMIVVIETVSFAAFVWVANLAANLIYSL
jgi:hypothetical protein